MTGWCCVYGKGISYLGYGRKIVGVPIEISKIKANVSFPHSKLKLLISDLY
jgi:hypothetical protein